MKKLEPTMVGTTIKLFDPSTEQTDIKYEVGNEYTTDYNHDCWCGHQTFRVTHIYSDGTVYGTCIEDTVMELDEEDVI